MEEFLRYCALQMAFIFENFTLFAFIVFFITAKSPFFNYSNYKIILKSIVSFAFTSKFTRMLLSPTCNLF